MRRRRAGFTLVELLVAISLAAGIVLAASLLARSAFDYEHRLGTLMSSRTALRDSQRLLEHYWGKREKKRYLFDQGRLLVYFSERGARYFAGFTCRREAGERWLLDYYRWRVENDDEPARVEGGGEWPAAARETLLGGLHECGFSFLRAPDPGNREAPALWTREWKGTDEPLALRFDAAGTRGALPPMIFTAPAS